MEVEERQRIGEYYSIVPHPDDVESGETLIRIDAGKFKETIIKFGKFKLNANDKDPDNVSASYEYEFVFVPKELQEENVTDEEGQEFEHMVGEILMKILYEYYQEKNGDDNTVIVN
mgnify:CR=1 FL=1